jgi:hypothetical protein
MAYSIEEIRRSRSATGQGIVVEDYSQNQSLCRKGTWTGVRSYFTETVVLGFTHDDEIQTMVWVINGNMFPGLAPFPGANPADPLAAGVRGVPGVRYYTPVDGFHHRLALYSEPGASPATIHLQVLYVMGSADNDAQYSASKAVHLAGQSTRWPRWKVDEEARCHQRFADVARRYLRWEEPAPLDPVIFDRMPAHEAVKVRAMMEELEHLTDDDVEIAEAIRAELTVQLTRYAGQQQVTVPEVATGEVAAPPSGFSAN